MSLGFISQVRGSFLIFLFDFILLLRGLLLLFSICLSILLGFLLVWLISSSLLLIFSLWSFFLWSRNIFLHSNLFIFSPFLSQLNTFKTWNLMNLVADSQNEGVFFMLWMAFFDFILSYLMGKSLKLWSILRIVN